MRGWDIRENVLILSNQISDIHANNTQQFRISNTPLISGDNTCDNSNRWIVCLQTQSFSSHQFGWSKFFLVKIEKMDLRSPPQHHIEWKCTIKHWNYIRPLWSQTPPHLRQGTSLTAWDRQLRWQYISIVVLGMSVHCCIFAFHWCEWEGFRKCDCFVYPNDGRPFEMNNVVMHHLIGL